MRGRDRRIGGEVSKVELLQGDCVEVLQTLPDQSVNCCVTSPPYFGLRDYGVDGQIGLEQSPKEYVEKLVQLFWEVKRVLKDDGTLWLNLGDSYAGNNSQASNGGRAGFGNPREKIVNRTGEGLKPKDLIGIPWMVAFALRDDGWYLRSEIIWHKPNPMPESVKDRPTKSHEQIFLLSKSEKYYYDYESIMELATGYDGRKDTVFKGSEKYKDTGQTFAKNGHERWKYKNLQADGQQPNTMHLNRLEGQEYLSPVRNKRSVWTIATKPYKEAHFATYPEELILPCILAGCPVGGTVLDPFNGAGTTGLVALKNDRNYIGIELNPKYIELTRKRLYPITAQSKLFDTTQTQSQLFEVSK